MEPAPTEPFLPDAVWKAAPALLDGQPLVETLQWYLPPRRPYSRRELLADRCVNFAGVAATFLSVPLLCWNSWQLGNPSLLQFSFMVQGLGYVTMFTCSALYHYWSWDWRCVPWLLAMDHTGISAMIMGCYTPYMLLFGYKHTLAFVWTLGTVGILMEVWKLKRPDLRLSGGGTGKWKPFDIVHGLIYVLMGWTALPFFPRLATYLPPLLVATFIGGGLFFTTGICALAKEHLEFHLAIWHAFVLAGSISFYIAALLLQFMVLTSWSLEKAEQQNALVMP